MSRGRARLPRPLAIALAVASLAVGVATGCRGRTPSSCDSARLWGVHQDLGYNGRSGVRQAAMDAAHTVLHAGISRSTLLWDQVEPRPGALDWSRYDDIVDGLRKRHVAVLLVLGGSPAWARGGGADATSRFAIPADDAAFDRWVDAFARFAGTAARRYRGKVRWEVWNEPNNVEFWTPTPDARRYAQLFPRVRTAILTADPRARVAVGGVNSMVTATAPSISGETFLTQLAGDGVDLTHVAIHPYPSGERSPASHVDGQNNVDDIATAIDLLRRTGVAHPDVWVTEIGWDRGRVGPQAQAADVGALLELLDARYPAVSVAIIFIDRDRPSFSFGLIDARGDVTPAGTMFASFAARHACRASLDGPSGRLAHSVES